MTPTPTVILLTALFWTLPATTAVLAYRKYDGSIENVKAALQRSIQRVRGGELQPQEA